MEFAEVVVTFNATVAGCPLMEVAVVAQEAPEGRPEHAKEILPVKPATGVRVRL